MRLSWMLVPALAALLSGCAGAAGPGSTREGCPALKRQKDAMEAEGRQNTNAYRRIVEAWQARCR